MYNKVGCCHDVFNSWQFAQFTNLVHVESVNLLPANDGEDEEDVSGEGHHLHQTLVVIKTTMDE